MGISFEVDQELEDDYGLLGESSRDGADDDDLDGDLEVEGFTEEDFAALGVDPNRPTKARPGSSEKVLVLSARYAAGLPLWHSDDCYEHGPREMDLRGRFPLIKRPEPLPIEEPV